MIELGATPEEDTCLNCGGHVTPDFCRVFGDQQGNAHACQDCTTYREITDGAAAGKEVLSDD